MVAGGQGEPGPIEHIDVVGPGVRRHGFEIGIGGRHRRIAGLQHLADPGVAGNHRGERAVFLDLALDGARE
jgi:hypothetical protein